MKSLLQLTKSLARLQSRFSAIARQDRYRRIVAQGAKPKLVVEFNRVQLRINREKNHKRPHFHLEFKTQYRASYDIKTGEKLVGVMPAKYEKEILKWATKNTNLLLEIWRGLEAGIDISIVCPKKKRT